MSGRAKRDVKPVDRLQAEEPKAAARDEPKAAAGSGTALGDIDRIKGAIDKLKSDDPALSKLHQLCYGTLGQKTTRKKTLRMFNGFPDGGGDEAAKEAKVEKLLSSKKVMVADLKAMLHVVGLEVSGSKEEQAGRLVAFLASPDPVDVKGKGKEAASTGGQKRKAASGKAGTKKKGKKGKKGGDSGDKPKRAPSAYMNFCKATRAAVVAELPEGHSFGEVGKEMGKRWSALSDKEKAAFKATPETETAAAEEEDEEEENEEEEEEEEEAEAAEEEAEAEKEEEAEEEEVADKKEEEPEKETAAAEETAAAAAAETTAE